MLPCYECLGTNALSLEATWKCRSTKLTCWQLSWQLSVIRESWAVCLDVILQDMGAEAVCCCSCRVLSSIGVKRMLLIQHRDLWKPGLHLSARQNKRCSLRKEPIYPHHKRVKVIPLFLEVVQNGRAYLLRCLEMSTES